MFDSLKKILSQNTNINEQNEDSENLDLLSGLMIEAANTDGNLDEVEIKKISYILVNTFNEDSNKVNNSLKKAIDNKNNSNSLYFYTSKLNKEFSHHKIILLIETMWEIILSDGKIHDYESSLIRRLSGLLYISDIDSGNARRRVLNKNN